MNLTKIYDKAFYDAQALESYKSAKAMLPYINEIFAPQSVVDVGCGVGTWLKAWSDINPHIQIAGIDGNEVDNKMYFIPRECYKKVDLCAHYEILHKDIIAHFAKNFMGGGKSSSLKNNHCDSTQNDSTQDNLSQSDSTRDNPTPKPFDLAQSLEVAEHLDECYAENFVALLTLLSNVVLFSAAIPYQSGTRHINCQPPAYWARIFARHDFACVDILRMQIWDDDAIASWYRQNTLLFIHKSEAELLARFHTTANPPHIVHPAMWESYIKMTQESWWRKIYHRIAPQYLRRLLKPLRAKFM